MTLPYTLTVEEHASPEDIQVIHQGLGKRFRGVFKPVERFDGAVRSRGEPVQVSKSRLRPWNWRARRPSPSRVRSAD